jgi:hypothetical protein
MTLRYASACLMLLAFASCGSKLSANYTGTCAWSGATLTSPPTQFNMTLYQNGSTVSGQWLATGGTNTPTMAGTFSGTVDGTTLNSVVLTIPAYSYFGGIQVTSATTMNGSLTVSSGILTGALTGTLNSQAVTVTLSLTQQQ